MTSLPSGTVTFLFTDIERSTQTLEAMGNEAYADALDTHRQLLRAAFKAHDGYEVDREGDSFFVTFTRAHDAVDAAVDGQRSLGEHPLRARMGIHTGEALVRGTEYVGHDVHKAKRVSDAGHGGQILVSQTTADLLGDHAVLVDLGPHRLKDLGEPQRIYQVGPGEFPPLRSLESFRNTLPRQRSAFIGREQDIATVRKLLETHPLVTLTGIGGCGKTRLALQVGAEVLEEYADGVFFTELGPLTDPGDVVPAVGRAVRLPASLVTPGPSAGAEEPLLSFLSGRRCLLILDNCEHLIDAAAEIADQTQQRCPDVSILATSREVLGLDGEQVFGVPSLSIDTDAMSLFTARAQAARPEFEITSANRGAIAEICQRLDGIPLAIEFAAARVSHLSAQQILDKLEDRFRLLTGGRRRVQRQQTLEAAMDWSFDLLDEHEQTLLARLAVFPADFGLPAAEGICSDEHLPRDQITDGLGSLVAKSLVQAVPQSDGLRYKLLETVRAYASGHLARAGEADRFRDKHRDHFLAWLDSIDWGDANPISEPTLQAEEKNLRGAMEWCDAQGRIDLLARIFVRSGSLYVVAWDDAVVNEWREALLAPDLGLDPSERAVALAFSASWAQLHHELSRAFELFDEAVAVAREGHPAVLAVVISFRGWMHGQNSAWKTGAERDRLIELAREDFDQALDLTRDRAPHVAAFVAGFAAQVEITLGDLATARQRLEEAVAPYGGSAGPAANQAGIHLAACLHVLGETDRALELVEDTLLDPDWDMLCVGFSAPVASILAARDITRATDLVRTVYPDAARIGVPGCFEDWVIGATGVLVAAKMHAPAGIVLSWVRAQTLDQGRGAGRSPAGFITYRHNVRIVREALGPDEARRCREEGARLSRDEMLTLLFQSLDQIDA